MVRVRALEKYFGAHHVLRGVDLDVAPGATTCIIGRSGSGKTTLLRCLNFLEEPSRGLIEIDGIALGADPMRVRSREHQAMIREIRRRAQMVFQEFNLFPHMRVIENVTEGPIRVKRLPPAKATALADEYLAKVGLFDKRNEYPGRLSGGQKQRVAIARALAMEPKVLLFDEPTSALDPSLIGEVLAVMEGLALEGRTMVVVTHEMEFARHAADTVHFIDEGAFVESGRPDQILDRPTDQRTRRFLVGFKEPPAEVHTT